MNKPKLNSMQMMTLISAGTLGVDILTVPGEWLKAQARMPGYPSCWAGCLP